MCGAIPIRNSASISEKKHAKDFRANLNCIALIILIALKIKQFYVEIG